MKYLRIVDAAAAFTATLVVEIIGNIYRLFIFLFFLFLTRQAKSVKLHLHGSRNEGDETLQ